MYQPRYNQPMIEIPREFPIVSQITVSQVWIKNLDRHQNLCHIIFMDLKNRGLTNGVSIHEHLFENGSRICKMDDLLNRHLLNFYTRYIRFWKNYDAAMRYLLAIHQLNPLDEQIISVTDYSRQDYAVLPLNDSLLIAQPA